jgi:hypothetical protein
MVLTITPSQESFILNLLDEDLVAIDDPSTKMAEAMVKDHYFSQTGPMLPQPVMTRQEKTVDFHIPTKRQKTSPDFDIKAVVSAVLSSVSRKDRINAVTNACVTFEHGIESIHDEEITAGADIALCKHLGFLLQQRSGMVLEENFEENNVTILKREETDTLPFDLVPEATRNDVGIMDEIGQTLSALEMVLRSSVASIFITFDRIGSELMLLLLEIIREGLVGNEDESKGRQGSRADLRISDSCLKSATKILGHFARVGTLTEPLANTKGLLTLLRAVIASSDGLAPKESKWNSLWIIANLSCNSECMVMIASHPGLMEMLVEVASHPTDKEERDVGSIMDYVGLLRSRSIAVRAILNLSWAQENKMPFSDHPQLVSVLLRIAKHKKSLWTGRGKGVSGILLQSRRYAAGAIRNLASAPRRNKATLCSYENGRFLDELAEIAANDSDSDVRDRIHAALFNLVCADTADYYTQSNFALQVILQAAFLERNKLPSNDDKEGTGMACRTLKTLEKAVPEDAAGFQVLRKILDEFEGPQVDESTLSSLGATEAV